ncbi:MAG: DnaJ domain-containing protein [Desulfotignum sp.]|jgi:DnaJ-class molecular chaperone|nr:DnaJ domain-containing protein [Desulfotignum sp.]
MPQDYYLVLGITSDASQADIKDAYRRLAKEYHPDHYKGNHRPFQAIQEAYAVLSDPARRRHHDSRILERKPAPRKAYTFSRPVEPLVPESSQKTFFRHTPTREFQPYRPLSEFFSRPIFAGQSPGNRQGTKDLSFMAVLTRKQARTGGQIRITIPARPVCPQCGGRGWTGPYPCWRCDQEGLLSADIPIIIHFPPDIRQGHKTTVFLDQYGMPGQHMTIHFMVKEDQA